MVGCDGSNKSSSLSGSFYNLVLFTCWGAGCGALEALASSPRMAASSSSVGEGPGSSSTGPSKEISITSSLSMVINGVMYCWSSLIVLHRTPGLAPDASAQACSDLAGASVFSWWMTWKFCGSEVGGKVLQVNPCRAGGASYHPEASCCASGSLKAVVYHKA